MIDPAPGIPPHIALLLNEQFDLGNPAKVVRKLKSMAGELRDQAQAGHAIYANELIMDHEKATVVLSGGLDLFSGIGACQALQCRLSYVDEVARSVVLMADQVALHDHFESFILSLKRRPVTGDVYPLLADFYVLQRLRPLIEAGLVKFLRTNIPVCNSCLNFFDSRVDAITDELVTTFAKQIVVDRSGAEPVIDSGDLFTPQLLYTCAREGVSEIPDSQLIREVIHPVVRAAMWDARDAALCDGLVFSNSRIGLAGLLHADDKRLNQADFQALEANNAANLPWIRGLTIEQTLQLRNEACNALPALRAFLGKRIKNASLGDGSIEPDYVAELREQAVEVRNELQLVTTRSRSLRRNVTGIVGLGIAAIGAAVDSPIGAALGLMGTLNLIHQMPEPEHKQEQLLKRRPAYVLIAAQDILAHAKSN